MSAFNSSRRNGSASSRTVPHTRIGDEKQIEEIYEFGKELGRGSFGVVFEALHKNSGMKWAIKAVNKEKAGSSAIKLLEREVAIMKKIEHEHLIYLEEVFETSKRMFLLMELCDQISLDALWKNKGVFTEKETLSVIRQMADAISYLHDNDIVHRDLKLENILLSKPTDVMEPMNIKISDFGLSYVKGGVGSESMMQSVCGTPMYMAPEVIDNQCYSQQCDVWSIGVIMYTLLTGVPPFVAPTEEKLYELIRQGHLDFSHPCWESIKESAKGLLKGMLKVDPALRVTAKEILNHPWIKGQEGASDPVPNVIEMMKLYSLEMKQQSDENGNMEEDDESAFSDASGSSISKSPDFLKDSPIKSSSQTKKGTPGQTKKQIGRQSGSQSGLSGSSQRDSGSPPRRENIGTKSVPSYMQPTKVQMLPKIPKPRKIGAQIKKDDII